MGTSVLWYNVKLNALQCKGDELLASVTQNFHLFVRIDFKLTTYAVLCSHPKFNTDLYWSVIYRKKPSPLEYSLIDLLDFKYMWLMKFNYNSGLREYVNRLISYCRLIIV